jgi:predicted enzyme related to lactoylglutathione lyase
MAIERLDSIMYFAADFARSLAFYRETLGLTLIELREGECAEFALGDAVGARLSLHVETCGDGVSAPVAFVAVSEIETTLDLLVGKGAKVLKPITHLNGATTATVLDPSGNAIALWQRN